MHLDISLVVPGITFNGETFEQLSVGGSESAGYYMAKALEALGHRVTVFTNAEKASRSGEVYYMPMAMFQQYSEFTPHDVMIVQRAPELFGTQHNARFAALWCHDLANLRSGDKIRGVAWNYDKVFVLSKFMRQQYKEVYGLPDEALHLTRNGIDLASVESSRAALHDKLAKEGSPTMDIVRDPFQMVCAARPERWADVMFTQIMPRILAFEPRAHLACATYFNPVEHLRDYYTQCAFWAKQFGDRINFVGHLTKHQLYQLYLQSGLYAYPTPALYGPEFAEISCLSLMEAQACGLPVVSSKHGALPETLAEGAGVLIDEPIHSDAYYDEFAQQAVRFMLDQEAWQQASEVGEAAAQGMDWSGVAQEWSDLFVQELRARNNNPVTLANHFWRHSDIYAARAVIEQEKKKAIDPEMGAPLPLHEGLERVAARIEKDWAFIDEEDGYRKQYERIGSTHNPDVINWVVGEPRYHVLRESLRKHGEEIHTVLDYGCAHGAYDINLLREHDGLSIVGVDIDEHGIALANSFAEKFEIAPGRWRGVVGDFEAVKDIVTTEGGDLFDCALAQEVLEHVARPWEVLRALEARVRDGGYVYITVPFGPWEYTDYKRYPHRAHVWEFDLHDLSDMLDVKGREAQVTINSMPAPEPIKYNPYSGEPMGWWDVVYRVTEATRGVVGEIDMERKLWLQKPRQTVSASLIAGEGSRETLLWCLDSLDHVVDEVVVVNCGMSETDLKVLSLAAVADSRLKVVPGVDPKVEGFETPRNIGLEHCTSDWVLWIDTDEKLLQPEKLAKYLHPNMFQGYSIKQHHFAVDTHFDADLPVRMFRNNGREHFWGMIHEHPELSLNEGPGRTIVLMDVHIPHVGYLIESGRKLRFARNLPMLEADSKRYPDRILQKHFIMRDNMLLCTYELQMNGGKITEEIKARARQTIAIWREHFKGKQHFSNIDPISYYSQAVALLGEGFDMHLSVSADKIDAKPNGALKARFANMDDAMVEVDRRARETVQPFTNPYY